MKKSISLILILLTTSLFSIEVDISEISQADRVDFVNYTGRDSKSETINEIRSIGTRLANLVRNGRSDVLYRYNMKYSALRAISKDSDKFSADIFFIDKTARVDHIKNVRRIISSYLERMYGYTTKEADAIAVYVTYYNAVYRGDIDFFSERYAPAVMKHLTKNNVGISTDYREWPGNTAIVVPLTEQNMRGEIHNIDTFAISDPRVRREVEKDKEDREATGTMDAVKQKEIDQSKKTIVEQKKTVETKKENIAQREKKIEAKKEEIRKDKEAAAKIADPVQRKAKEDEIKKKEAEVKREERRIAEEQKKIDATESQVKKAETTVEKKEEDLNNAKNNNQSQDTAARNEDKTQAQTQLTQAQKEAELIKKEDALKNQDKGDGLYAEKIYFLDIKDYFEGGHYNNILFRINTQTNRIEQRSPFTDICGRKYDVFSGGIVVIAHNGSHRAGHKLTIIDRDKLTEIVSSSGEENIFWRSFVEVKHDHIFVIIKDKTKDEFYLGKFDKDLKLVAKSKDKIFMNTYITFFNEFIYVSREDKAVMVLKESDLSFVSAMRP